MPDIEPQEVPEISAEGRNEKSKAGEFLIESCGQVGGIHNSTGKFAPDKAVIMNDEPFDDRLERAIRAEKDAVKRNLDNCL